MCGIRRGLNFLSALPLKDSSNSQPFQSSIYKMLFFVSDLASSVLVRRIDGPLAHCRPPVTRINILTGLAIGRMANI